MLGSMVTRTLRDLAWYTPAQTRKLAAAWRAALCGAALALAPAASACGESSDDGAGGTGGSGTAGATTTGGAGGGAGQGGGGTAGGAGVAGTGGTAGSGGGATLPDPAVMRCADEAAVCSPTPPADCTPADMAFVASEYGSTVTRADDAGGTETVFRIIALVERVGPSNIDVRVVDETGALMVGVPVAFYWPGAPDPSRPDEWYPVQITTMTGANGIAGFALGSGAYLSCCGCGGPHAIWVSVPGAEPDTTVPSDLADHLGMLGGTNHRHLEVEFQRVAPPPAPSPVDAVVCPLN